MLIVHHGNDNPAITTTSAVSNGDGTKPSAAKSTDNSAVTLESKE